MNLTDFNLVAAIRNFVAILDHCLSATTFAEDRHLYVADIGAANAWLTRLLEGELPSVIAEEILAPTTTKQFTDYWRQGVWGGAESAALKALQDAVREVVGSGASDGSSSA